MGIQQTLPTFTNRKTYSVIIDVGSWLDIFRSGLLYYTTYPISWEPFESTVEIHWPTILRDFPVDFWHSGWCSSWGVWPALCGNLQWIVRLSKVWRLRPESIAVFTTSGEHWIFSCLMHGFEWMKWVSDVSDLFKNTSATHTVRISTLWGIERDSSIS